MRYGIPFIALALSLLLVGSAAASSGSLVHDEDRLDLRERGVLDTELPFELLTLPEHLRSELTPSMDTTLPGPNEPLSLDANLLIHQVRSPDLASRLGQTPLPSLATNDAISSSTDATEAAGTSDGPPGTAQTASNDDASDPTAAPPASAGTSSTGASAQSASSAPSSSSNPVADAWNSLDDGEKAAAAAGLIGLLLLGPLTMYSRIKRDEALENDTRRSVYDIVSSNPGICIKDVADKADVSYSTASYHLDRLVRMDYLSRKEEGNKVLYYKNGGTFSNDEQELVPVLQNEEAMRVFMHILENPWCYRAEVAEALGVSHTTVNWHLKRLTGTELVEEHREGRNCHLWIPEEAFQRVTDVMDKLEQMGAENAPELEATPAVA